MPIRWARIASTKASGFILQKHCKHKLNFPNIILKGQGRIDGASCDYSEAEKMTFLKECYAKGIRNIEMEAPMFASLTKHVGVKAADICVTIVNRLNGDQASARRPIHRPSYIYYFHLSFQVEVTSETKKEFEHRPFLIVGRYIKKLLAN